MATFRDLLQAIQGLSEAQLDQEVVIIPTGYCSAAPLDVNGYSAFVGSVEVAEAKGNIVCDEAFGTSGVLDMGEVEPDAQEGLAEAEVILPAGAAYLRIGE